MQIFVDACNGEKIKPALFLLTISIVFGHTYWPNNWDGNGVGQGQRMGSSSPPRMVLSCPIPASPRMTGNTFSLHLRPLGPYEVPSHPVKLYFLLI